MVVRGVIFDVGGTLISSNHDKFEEACAWSAVNAFRSHGFRGAPETLWRELVKLRRSPKEGLEHRQIHTTRWALGEIAARNKFTLKDGLLNEVESAFVTPEAHGSVALPGILEVIDRLKGRVEIGVVSNTRSHLLIEKTLEYLGVRAVFDPLVTSAGCGWRKPSPHIFREVLEVWKLPADQVVMIGDSLAKDVLGAKALGLRTVRLNLDATEGFSSADAEAETPSQIPDILASWDTG